MIFDQLIKIVYAKFHVESKAILDAKLKVETCKRI